MGKGAIIRDVKGRSSQRSKRKVTSKTPSMARGVRGFGPGARIPATVAARKVTSPKVTR